ncbi:MAG: hypothetical protein P1U32_01035 [Legionellaceae bacterium]|nr:hypothetical protein [Legionellaceae bacterium]
MPKPKQKDPIETVARATTSAWLAWRIKRADSWIANVDKEIQKIQEKPVRFNEALLKEAKKDIDTLKSQKGLSDEERVQKEDKIWEKYEKSKQSGKVGFLSKIGIAFLNILKGFYQGERSRLQTEKMKNDLQQTITQSYADQQKQSTTTDKNTPSSEPEQTKPKL